MTDHDDVLAKVRRALGRTHTLTAPPTPPAIDEPITRLVHTDIGLPQLFAKRAQEMHMGVTFVAPDEVAASIAWFLGEHQCKKIALPASKLLDQLWVADALKREGLEVHQWDEPSLTLDALYDGFDCAVTDVSYAVAETGSLVIKPSPSQGRALSLVPMYHVAVVEPRQILPDLVDLFQRLAEEGAGSNTIIISGPSKTADIEMNVVTGVHGPNVVQVFLLR
jgi:L-lactate dehydrogenase complex protein LldG